MCVRQDNTQEWQSVIEISIKEVISGVIAEALWFVFVCVRERQRERKTERKRERNYRMGEKNSGVVVLRICHSSLYNSHRILSFHFPESLHKAPRLLRRCFWY